VTEIFAYNQALSRKHTSKNIVLYMPF